VLYLVQWKGGSTADISYEIATDMVSHFGQPVWDTLLRDFNRQQVAEEFYTSYTAEERDELPLVPDLEQVPLSNLPPRRRAQVQEQNVSREELFRHGCKPRAAETPHATTYGTLHAFCACGFMFPPWVMKASESCTQVHMYLSALWQGRDRFPIRGERLNVGYDNACRLLLMAKNPKRLTAAAPPLAHSLVNDCNLVVDHFHFEGHTGAFCAMNCSPYKFAELHKANMSVAEQRFHWFAKFNGIMRHMNKERFEFMLMVITGLDHKMRTEGWL
jgi:hypothetical protein